MEKDTGLRFGFAFTTLFQSATGSGDNRDAASGDLDLLLRWNLVGHGTQNPGTLIFNSEYRFQIGGLPPSSLGREIGVGIPTTNGFSERPMVIKELYWVQHAFDGVIRAGIGRVDPENLTGGHKLQSANTLFLNKAFSGNPAIAYPGSGLGAAAALRPNESWYASIGAANAYGQTSQAQVESLFENWDLFSFAEAGITPTIDVLGGGRYRIALWHLDEREGSSVAPDDWGLSLIADQDLGERWQAFFRYGWSEADVTGIANLYEGGVTYRGLFGEESITGAAAAFADFSDADRNDETIFEVFQRWQLTSFAQFTIGAQLIVDPADAPDDDAVGVFSARLRFAF